jgi:NAD(P)-dependent dehydrogenase (short-subunit alcohol dehydrogenase family)
MSDPLDPVRARSQLLAQGVMQIRFDGKTVVVSGAGHGFGRCIAETFAALGAGVFGGDLATAQLAETAKAGVSTEVVDLADRAAAAAWIVRVEQATGGAVDVLVNNAGGVAGQEMRPIEEVPDHDWDRIFAVNIGAAFALSRAAAAGMKRARAGRIVNISSGAGLAGRFADRYPGLLLGKTRGGRSDAATGARARTVWHYCQQCCAGFHAVQPGIREAVGKATARTGKRRSLSASR